MQSVVLPKRLGWNGWEPNPESRFEPRQCLLPTAPSRVVTSPYSVYSVVV